MKGLPLKLKDRLYSAFVHSVLLYNCEVWNITETDMKALVGRNGCLMRKLIEEVVRSADDKRLTESQALEMLGLVHRSQYKSHIWRGTYAIICRGLWHHIIGQLFF